MSGYVDHAWRHRPKALGGTDPIESGSAVVPTAIKLRTWAHTVGTGTGFDIDDLADFNGQYVSNDTDVYFDDYSDSTLGYSREAIEIHASGIYLFTWLAALSFGSSGGPLWVAAYPNYSTAGLDDALDSFRAVWNANYDYVTESGAYGSTQLKRLGGADYWYATSATPTRFALRIESNGGTANWTIQQISLRVTRLGDIGTIVT